MISDGEEYAIHCSARPEERHHLPRGLYTLHIKAGCQLSGEGWTINGVVHFNSKLSMKHPTIDTVPLDLLNITRHEMIERFLDNPEWKALGEIKDISIEHLIQSKDNAYKHIVWGSYSGHISWSLIIIIVLFLRLLLG
jgi:hypothetical protein